MMDQLLERDGSNDPPILADVIEQSMIDADDTQHDSQVRMFLPLFLSSFLSSHHKIKMCTTYVYSSVRSNISPF